MRKLIILLILLLPTLAFAQGGMGMGPGPGCKGYAAASCTTDNDSAIESSSGSLTGSDALAYMATNIVLAANTTVTQYIVNACRVSSASENYRISLYTDNAGQPGTEISGTDSTIANSSLNNQYSYADVTATLATPKLVTAQTVWLVVAAPSTKFRWGWITATGKTRCSSSDGSTWSCTASRSDAHTLMGCQ